MSTVTTETATIDTARRYTVIVTVQGGDSGALQRLVSVFHRRQVEILDLTYSSLAELRRMVASVKTTAPRLHTLALTLGNAVGVTGYEYEVAPDTDDTLEGGDRPVPALTPRRPTKTIRQEYV